MLRAMWTGSISFGLVGIPVKAIPAQSPKDIRFELLHGPCHSKTSTKRHCPKCEREAEDGEMVRAFQHTKGQYVIMDPAEMETLGTPAKRTIQILDFVSMSEIDPIYYEKPYYLQPSEGGERTYTLLHRAMKESGKVGIGKVALREREHLALIRPIDTALVMEILSFPDEVRILEEPLAPLDAHIDDRELAMAHMLISSLSANFAPEKYHDEYREALTSMIQQKVEGGTVTTTAAPPPSSAGVSDLMEMLRRSIEAAGGATPAVAAPVAAIEGDDPFVEGEKPRNGRRNGTPVAV